MDLFVSPQAASHVFFILGVVLASLVLALFWEIGIRIYWAYLASTAGRYRSAHPPERHESRYGPQDLSMNVMSPNWYRSAPVEPAEMQQEVEVSREALSAEREFGKVIQDYREEQPKRPVRFWHVGVHRWVPVPKNWFTHP